ncbi:uncharacterized protein LOC118945315 isoform X2 [Oncorhynchus mykiss]|uniref:uncharacterized protein LOC118945315 isoform X2 n=1 Tax=Oncorhynchus mykiss TaxID=8022 RepID=UPI0018781915|nr:uncharacterized protein LOC118945315 isoform X2 [Oncorhynchus mykiss]
MTAKCVFYMDDVNILCTDLLSVDRTLDRTDWYGRASGARLNRDKTEAQFFGPWADPDLTRLPLTVKLTDIRVLGVKFDRGGGGSGNWSGILGTDREPVCPVRGLAIGEPTTVWRNVAHPALLNRHRDLSWMVAHEILPVRAVMHSRGMARTSACPRPGCGQEESVRHMLWECRAARDLWKEAGPLITSCLPAGEDLTPQLVLYGVGRRPIPSKAFTKLWPTLTCLKEALWSSRNLLVAKNVETTPQAVAMVATEALGWYGRKGASTPGEGSPTTP